METFRLLKIFLTHSLWDIIVTDNICTCATEVRIPPVNMAAVCESLRAQDRETSASR